MKNNKTNRTTEYKQFAFEFWDWASGRNQVSWNTAEQIVGLVMSELTREVTNRQLLSLCWAEYKRRNA